MSNAEEVLESWQEADKNLKRPPGQAPDHFDSEVRLHNTNPEPGPVTIRHLDGSAVTERPLTASEKALIAATDLGRDE